MEFLAALSIPLGIAGLVLIAVVIATLRAGFRVVAEYERLVVFRLGRVIAPKGPGLVFLIPYIDSPVRVSLRTLVLDVPKQDVITRDNISVAVNAVVYFQVLDPVRSIITVQDFQYATAQLAQTTMRSIVGEFELDEVLSQREKINERLTRILDEDTDPWGIKVTKVDLKDIDLPLEMKRAMARQAEAERERRAKVIAAEGELQASEKLGQAADVMQRSPMSLQLRYLQTLVEISAEKNSTTIFPVPIDLLGAFMKHLGSPPPVADKP